MSYARVLDDTIVMVGHPPELLDPEDVTAEDRWWDLRHHENLSPAQWEIEIIRPHGWLPIVTTPRPPDTATDTSDYSLELIDGQPTEVWTVRPWADSELSAQDAALNTSQMTVEQNESVDKLVLVVEALNAITDLTNAEINANPAAIIKDLARECKTIARVANREARLTSGRTEDTFTGEEEVEDVPTSQWTKTQIISWLVEHGVIVNVSAANRFTKDELLDMVAAYEN